MRSSNLCIGPARALSGRCGVDFSRPPEDEFGLEEIGYGRLGIRGTSRSGLILGLCRGVSTIFAGLGSNCLPPVHNTLCSLKFSTRDD